MFRKDLIVFLRAGKSWRQIASETNKSVGSIRYWLDKHGLQTRLQAREKIGRIVKRKCLTCGTTKRGDFYTKRKSACRRCHNDSVIDYGRKRRQQIVKHLGGKCTQCGYRKYQSALETHHLDPSKKDRNFGSSRNWGWERVKKELVGCALLCSNCHAGIHSGELVI